MSDSSLGRHVRQLDLRRPLILMALVAAGWGCGARTSFEGLEDDGGPHGCASPAPEECNAIDDDCDLEVDEDLSLPCPWGPARVCVAGVWGECDEPPACASAADCDDGLFCTGAERCENDVCASGEPVDCGPTDACVANECDEAADRCVAVSLAVDQDGDGSAAPPCGSDCDDLDPLVGPGRIETCNAIDDDCDLEVDEDLVRPCGDGLAQRCTAGVWGACEVCSDPEAPVLPGWQEHAGEGPLCFGVTFGLHGELGEYDWAEIPPADDAGWSARLADDVSFDRGSPLCESRCTCLDGADFTYFQQFVEIDSGYVVDSCLLSISEVDDGARVSLFNPIFPDGLEVGIIMSIDGPLDFDLAPHLSTGENRIVVTHNDDCCSGSVMVGPSIEIAGHVENPCESCDPGLTRCDDGCRDIDNDPDNCGRCGNACGPETECIDGQCECDAGNSMCSGVCVDLQTDADNCGECGFDCTGPQAHCNRGACLCNPHQAPEQCEAGEICCLGRCRPPGSC